MTKQALPSDVGDIVQQRRIDLAAAYRSLCRFSLNDNIDRHISVSFPGPQHLLFESIRSGYGLDWQPHVTPSQSISTATVPTIPSDWV